MAWGHLEAGNDALARLNRLAYFQKDFYFNALSNEANFVNPYQNIAISESFPNGIINAVKNGFHTTLSSSLGGGKIQGTRGEVY